MVSAGDLGLIMPPKISLSLLQLVIFSNGKFSNHLQYLSQISNTINHAISDRSAFYLWQGFWQVC